MNNHITTLKKNETSQSLQTLLNELREIKFYLKKFLFIIPEESLKKYQNSSEIKKAYSNALKSFPVSKK